MDGYVRVIGRLYFYWQWLNCLGIGVNLSNDFDDKSVELELLFANASFGVGFYYGSIEEDGEDISSTV